MGHQLSPDRALTNERGSVLLVGLLLVLAVTLIGVGLFQAATIETRDILYTERNVRAFYAADTGLSRASLDMAKDNVATSLFTPSTFDYVKSQLVDDNIKYPFYPSRCFGNQWTDSCNSANNSKNPAYLVQAMKHADADKFWLISTACIPGPATNPCGQDAAAAAQVKALIQKTVGGGPTMPFALFGASTSISPSLDLGSGGSVDSYKSAECGGGSYAVVANRGKNGDIGSNGSIKLNGFSVKGDVLNTTNVTGTDVTIASGSSVDGTIKSGGTVANSGTVTCASSPCITENTGSSSISLPPVDWAAKCPSGYTTLSSSNVKVGTLGVDYTYSSGNLIIQNPVTLTPGNYCINYLETHAALTLDYDPSSPSSMAVPTVVYVQGGDSSGKAVVIKSGSSLNNLSQEADNFQLVVASNYDKAGVDINFSGDAYMTIYAPGTEVNVGSSGGNVYGAIVARDIVFRAQESFHFDECLLTSSKLVAGMSTTTTINYGLLQWQQAKCRQTSPSSPWSCS